jgi:gas vesicle protein
MSPDNSNRSCAGGVAIALFAGIAIGAAIGILFAPKSGKETRQELLEKGEKFVEMSKDGITDLMEKTKDFAENTKERFEEVKVIGEEMIEAGKKKAKKTVKKVKDIVEESKAAAKETEDYLS